MESESSFMKLPPMREFDAFPKTLPTYKQRSTRGGFVTVGIFLLICWLVSHELQEYLFGEPKWSFTVDKGIGHWLQINLDMTVAMPCHYITVDVRDAVGDRLHMTSEFKKDGTHFEIGQAQRIASINNPRTADPGVGAKVKQAGKSARFKETRSPVEEGPACRIYGSTEVKKVTGNLHVTTLGHGYLSWEHTDHAIMNLTHVINELSFGPFFPSISQPLDNSAEWTNAHFHIFQYFLSVVSTTYIDKFGRVLETNQYSVTDLSRETEHGRGIPGIFFKYDIEPLHMTIEERTSSLYYLIIRLIGIIGGVVVCSEFGFRVSGAGIDYIKKKFDDSDENLTPSLSSARLDEKRGLLSGLHNRTKSFG